MRIVFVTAGLRNGGAERETAVFASLLAELKQEVHIVCIRDPVSDYILDPKVHLHRLSLVSRINIPKLRVLFRWRNAVLGLRSLQADVIVIINLPLDYYLIPWFAKLFSKTKILYAIRNNMERKYTKPKDVYRWRRVLRYADGIWIQTKEQERFIPKASREKRFEVPNILDPRFLQIPEHEHDKVCRFISVGRHHPQKNQQLLIEAFAKMYQRTGDQNVTLTIYGQSMPWDDSTEEELNALIHKYHLESKVFLAGRSKEIEKCYEEADVFVFSSDYEGFPNALMEAMAAGLPCISTDCPTGPADLILNGENGKLIPVGDVEAMAWEMEYFVKYPQQAVRMGKAARRRMQLWKSQNELADMLLENFRRICGYS